MDQAHPITNFLQNYGYWIRSISLGLVLCLMLSSGFLTRDIAQPDDVSKMLYIGLFLLGVTSPTMGQWAFAPFWQKITPIKDRITYIENVIVFIGSALLGVSAALCIWVVVSPLAAVRISLWALMAILPILFLIWLIKATLDPLSTHDTSSQVAAAQDFRDQTPYFWKNAIAYVATAVVTALVISLTIWLLLLYRGGSINFGTGCTSVISMIIVNLIAAPLFIGIGSKLLPRKNDAKGLKYSIGGIAFLTVIACLNLPMILKTVSEPGHLMNQETLLNAGPFAAAYILISLSYMAGGYTLSKLYKPKPPGLEFA